MTVTDIFTHNTYGFLQGTLNILTKIKDLRNIRQNMQNPR